MPDPSQNPFGRVVGPWQQVIEEMAATAAAQRDAGQNVLELHPGDVATLTGEPRTGAELERGVDLAARRLGLDVVVPGDEFETLRRTLGDRRVESYEVFRATEAEIVFLLIDVTAGDCTVLLPAYYDLDEQAALERVAREHGLAAHVRSLSSDTAVSFDFDAPSPFFPD